MSDTAFPITFDPNASRDNTSERRFVNLEQVRESFDPNKTVTMADIRQMIARAKSGIAAATYGFESCPMTINDQTYTMWFDFYVWPSSMKLEFTLESTMGEISEPQIVEPLTEFSVIFDDTDAVELDFILTELVGLPYWETLCCYKVDGTPVYGVTIELEGTSTLVASEKIFGVARVRGYKKGAHHRLTTTLIPHVPPTDAYEIIMISGITLYNPSYNISLGPTLRKQNWKLEFTSSTEYRVVGDTIGILDEIGSTGVDYVCKYFTIPHELLDKVYTYTSKILFSIRLSEDLGDNWGYTDIVTWIGNDDEEQLVPESNINMTGAKISNLNVTVTARWLDRNGEEQTESLKMEIAKCVQDALDLCDGNGGTIIDPVPGEDFYIGYFSICDSDIIEVRKVKDSDD